MYISPQEFIKDLRSGRPIKIKVLNLGENLGMDFAYFCHYKIMKEFFPNVEIHLYRSNVDETNCIGLETYRGKVNLPVDDLQMAVVKQRYQLEGGGETDWVNLLNEGDPTVFPDGFVSDEGFDYIWRIGMASAPILEQFWPTAKWIDSNIAANALEIHNNEVAHLGLGRKVYPIDGKVGWDRTLLEYMCMDDDDYPFTFTDEYIAENMDLAYNYRDYLRVGLRWPDYVRWYYGINKQFNVIFDIVRRLRELGKPVKIIFTLKDGEVGKNFNRGQTPDLLARLQDMCDDILFTYSWTVAPYHHRLSEKHELQQLRNCGIENVRRLDIWQDILLARNCKTYLSDPGGFAEFITILRTNRYSNFLFPVSFEHAATYITLDRDREPIKFKVHPIVIDQCFQCTPTLNPENTRTTHWDIKYKDSEAQIGDDNHGDDWLHFQNAQDGIYTEWYNSTAPDLVAAVVESYIKKLI